MIIEALSFKLALDFLEYLKKNRINTSGIRLLFWDRIRNEYVGYEDTEKMSSYFDVYYKNINDCELGSICSLELFRGASSLYDFETTCVASNITGAYKLTNGSSFDIQRNTQRGILVNRQIAFINQAIEEYLAFYREIRQIYVTGIYSPCYAVPGWSQGTMYLNTLRNALLNGKITGEYVQNQDELLIQPKITINTINRYDVQRRSMIARLTYDILIISNRISFIQDIIAGDININITPLDDIINYLEINNFDKVNDKYDYLLSMPIYTLNNQTLVELQQLKINKEEQLSLL